MINDLKTLGYLLSTQIVAIFSSFIPKNNLKVLFFSTPDYADNAKFIYDKMVELKLDTKFNLIWISSNVLPVRYVIRRTLQYYFHILTAKYIIATHGIPFWKSYNQVAIFTEHGLPFKASGYLALLSFQQRISLLITSKKINYFLSTSRFHALIISRIWRVPLNKIMITGWPRLDGLFRHNPVEIAGQLGIKKIKDQKLILYAPTFRENSTDDFSKTLLKNDRFQLYLTDMKFILVYKPHIKIDDPPVKPSHSNIIILKNRDLERKKLHLYDLLSIFDLIVTDYSSIFYEATLLDKPLIFYVPDLLEYSRKRGFLFHPKKWLPGPISTTPDSLLIALNEITENDKYKQKRCFIKELMFDEYDNCSQRVVNSLFKAHQS
jgi:CDP-glycerol glycerophosphotransferase (TagB/SpsB family)